MKKTKREEVLRKVILQAGRDRLTSDFTDMVMKDVLAASDEQVAIDSGLKALLQHGTETPVGDLASLVMARLGSLPQKIEYRPLISKQTWQWVGVVLAFMIFVMLYSSHSANRISDTAPGKNSLSNVMDAVSDISPIYLLVLIAVSFLLGSEYVISRQLNNTR